MQDHYDFSDARPNPYAERLAGQPLSTPTTRGEQPAILPLHLDADLLKDFPDEQSVNDALRRFRQIKQVMQG